MSTGIVVTLLPADRTALADETAFRTALERFAPYVRVRSVAISEAAKILGGALVSLRAIEAASYSDAVFVLAPEKSTTTQAALITLREEAGFTRRELEPEPEFARRWRSSAGKRDLYLVGALPGGYAALALAFEHTFHDRSARAALSATFTDRKPGAQIVWSRETTGIELEVS
jgi:hypothetical protein